MHKTVLTRHFSPLLAASPLTTYKSLAVFPEHLKLLHSSFMLRSSAGRNRFCLQIHLSFILFTSHLPRFRLSALTKKGKNGKKLPNNENRKFMRKEFSIENNHRISKRSLLLSVIFHCPPPLHTERHCSTLLPFICAKSSDAGGRLSTSWHPTRKSKRM